ncbi:hypothetical protein Peur_030476 [Populus x canadensis]
MRCNPCEEEATSTLFLWFPPPMNAHKLILVPPLLTHLFSLYLPPQQAPPPHPPQQHSNQPHQKSLQAESSFHYNLSKLHPRQIPSLKLPTSYQPKRPKPDLNQRSTFLQQLATLVQSTNLQELLHMGELQLTKGLESEQLSALYFLEHSLVSDAPSHQVCSVPELIRRWWQI